MSQQHKTAKEKTGDVLNRNEFKDTILNNGKDVIYLVEVTKDGRFIHKDINREFYESLGVPKDAIVGRYVDELENKEFRNILLEKYSACLKAGVETNYIGEYNFPTGKKIFHSTLSPIYDENGKICQIMGMARDIAQYKESDEVLTQRE